MTDFSDRLPTPRMRDIYRGKNIAPDRRAKYLRLWVSQGKLPEEALEGLPPETASEPKPLSRAASKPSPKIARQGPDTDDFLGPNDGSLCSFRLAYIEDRQCDTCGNRHLKKPVHGCSVHGECSDWNGFKKVRCCTWCQSYAGDGEASQDTTAPTVEEREAVESIDHAQKPSAVPPRKSFRAGDIRPRRAMGGIGVG